MARQFRAIISHRVRSRPITPNPLGPLTWSVRDHRVGSEDGSRPISGGGDRLACGGSGAGYRAPYGSVPEFYAT